MPKWIIDVEDRNTINPIGFFVCSLHSRSFSTKLVSLKLEYTLLRSAKTFSRTTYHGSAAWKADRDCHERAPDPLVPDGPPDPHRIPAEYPHFPPASLRVIFLPSPILIKCHLCNCFCPTRWVCFPFPWGHFNLAVIRDIFTLLTQKVEKVDCLLTTN